MVWFLESLKLVEYFLDMLRVKTHFLDEQNINTAIKSYSSKTNGKNYTF